MLLIRFGVNQDIIDKYNNKLIKVWLEFPSPLKTIVSPLAPWKITVFVKQSRRALFLPNQFIPRIISKSLNSRGIKSLFGIAVAVVVVVCVARVRRRGENISPTLNLKCKPIWQIWGDKKFLLFIGRKWNGSRHLVFWSLGTLTGLRDRVRGHGCVKGRY
jgi:hypothetical protein